VYIKFLPEKNCVKKPSDDTDKGLVAGLLVSQEEPSSKELVVIVEI
jgi:hypothetical protein